MDDFENISKFIEKYNLKLFTDVSEDLICIICKKIMINATIAPCRCRYCYECIKEYVNGKNKFCPGSAKYCKIDILNFQQDIHIDKIINIRISKLIVKCPQKTCEFKSELNLIKEHLEICDKRFVECPFLQMGCNKEDVQLNDVKTHLHDDSFTHNKLLIEYINNFKNDIEILKNSMVKMKTENDALKQEVVDNYSNAEIKTLELNEKIEILENQNKAMKDEIISLNSEIDMLKVMRDNDELKMMCENIEEKQKEMEIKSEIWNELTEKISVTDLEDIESDIDDINDNISIIDEKLNNFQTTLKTKEFIWKIENLSEKIKTTQSKADKFIYSDSFYTHINGYKMCLYASPNGWGKSKGFFGVFFMMVIGDYDDILSWPCKIDVTIQLINQNSGTVFMTRERKYENNSNNEFYQKPKSDKNKGLGNTHFIKLDELLRKTNVIENNQLFIRCITRLLD